MTRLIRKTEIINDTFGIKVNHKKLIDGDSFEIYRVTLGKKSYCQDVDVNIEILEGIKKDVDEVIKICEIIKLQEKILKENDFNGG